MVLGAASIGRVGLFGFVVFVDVVGLLVCFFFGGLLSFLVGLVCLLFCLGEAFEVHFWVCFMEPTWVSQKKLHPFSPRLSTDLGQTPRVCLSLDLVPLSEPNCHQFG